MAAAKDRKTPGVNVTELSAVPTAIVGVQTAVPVFVGYTETAADPASGKSLRMVAVPIQSMDDYAAYFGGGYLSQFAVAPATAGEYDFTASDANGDPAPYGVARTGTAQYNMFVALKMFYGNGGGACYVVSTGSYKTIARQDLLDGLAAAENLAGPTMLIVPDACLLTQPGDYSGVTVAQLKQAGGLRDRMAIVDLPGALDPESWTAAGLDAQRGQFYEAIAPTPQACLSFGAAYAPALRVSVLGLNDVDYRNLQGTQAGSDLLKSLLVAQAGEIFGADTSKGQQILAKLDLAFPADVGQSGVAEADIASLNAFLANALPLYAQIEAIVVGKLNVATPSGAMAGLWTYNDAMRDVWNAPANVSVTYAVAPEVDLTTEQQGDYNVPTNGMAIDILRSFLNNGTVVWGARTLDGNSGDYRYIQVRRTLIYIEQSIKAALGQFALAPNDAQTWAAVTAMISDFLRTVWSQGGLMGATASEAYRVECGLGWTMTAQDVADGIMIVAVLVEMIHPAEYIELTFRQTMQTA